MIFETKSYARWESDYHTFHIICLMSKTWGYWISSNHFIRTILKFLYDNSRVLFPRVCCKKVSKCFRNISFNELFFSNKESHVFIKLWFRVILCQTQTEFYIQIVNECFISHFTFPRNSRAPASIDHVSCGWNMD